MKEIVKSKWKETLGIEHLKHCFRNREYRIAKAACETLVSLTNKYGRRVVIEEFIGRSDTKIADVRINKLSFPVGPPIIIFSGKFDQEEGVYLNIVVAFQPIPHLLSLKVSTRAKLKDFQNSKET